jgi:transcriptional regulator with XRE-family HTH domain
VRRERLSAARKAIGKTQEQVAEDVKVDRTTIGLWERGEYTPRPDQRPLYAEALGLSLAELDGLLSSIPSEDRTPLWARQFLGMEQSATEILAHEPHVVHGLLQTSDYVAAIARSVGVAETSETYIKRNIEQRKWRQSRVYSGELRLHVVQPEIPLHLQMGDRTTMAAQMDQLAEIAGRPNVTLQIVPFSVGQYEALRMGSISIMSHPWVQGVSVYLVEHRGLAAIEDAAEAGNYVAAVEQAAGLALSPDASMRCIERIAKQWRTDDE